ncbi:hypothetical protein Y032_0412g987 [Ancylostoma ceylanicum]|uniref:Uncharacterized protein n=1 Tax=Ancylostoma ceylanicum TaxID=53326 RepID=A0A016X260_9BILA|nr:hypothetical protein Y032_0412g987 [Ancylostoma ceylanicum]
MYRDPLHQYPLWTASKGRRGSSHFTSSKLLPRPLRPEKHLVSSDMTAVSSTKRNIPNARRDFDVTNGGVLKAPPIRGKQ